MTLPIALDVTLRISAVILIGLAAAAMLRRRSAALRHWIIAATLLCAAVTPILQVVVPAWGWKPDAEPATVLATLPERPQPADLAASALPRTVLSAQMLGSIWLMGVALSGGVLLIGIARLTWLASRAQRLVGDPWNDIADDVARRYGITRRVDLLQTDHPTMLVTWGLRVPKVMLPAAARHWSSHRARIVVGHELAHIQRRDWVTHIGGEFVRCIYWFNPLVWIACARLRRESEHACDDAVLNLGVDGAEYATELVELARTFGAYRRSVFPPTPAPAMARASSLERRVRAMLNHRLNRTPITRLACSATVIALVGLTLPLAGFGAPQTGPATFSGSLLDTIGRILPDVPMTLTNVATASKHETHSDAEGRFAFAAVPAGEYELDARMPGFTTRYRVAVNAGQTLQQNVTLQLGSLEETITIIASSAPSVRKAPAGDPPVHIRAPNACDQSPTGGCIEQPMKIRDVKPRYPDNRTDGATVELECRIGTDGRVNRVRAIAPADQDFASAAIEAVQQWRFTPTYLDGVAVEVDMRVHATFRAE